MSSCDTARDLLKMEGEADSVSALVVKGESNGMQMPAATSLPRDVPTASHPNEVERQQSSSLVQPPITVLMSQKHGLMPQFPTLPTQIPVTPFHFDLLADVQDIAKEALRLTKETLYRHGNHLGKVEFHHFPQLREGMDVVSNFMSLPFQTKLTYLRISHRRYHAMDRSGATIRAPCHFQGPVQQMVAHVSTNSFVDCMTCLFPRKILAS
jgi:hypothetical protein